MHEHPTNGPRMRLSRVWMPAAIIAVLGVFAYIIAVWPYVPLTAKWRAQRSYRQDEQARELAPGLTSHRPVVAIPGSAAGLREARAAAAPQPVVFSSGADYSDEQVLKEAFWDIPLHRAFMERYTVAPARGLQAGMARAMQRQAEKIGLNGKRLREILMFIANEPRNRRNVLLPVYAEHARYRGRPVWIVVLAWEIASAPSDARLVHIRVYAIAERSNKILAFLTCS